MLRLIENNNILTSDELDVLNREVVWLYYYVVKIVIIGAIPLFSLDVLSVFLCCLVQY